MAQETIATLLKQPRVSGVVSQIAAVPNTLSSFYGLTPGGANERRVGGNQASWDYFDNTQETSGIRPGSMGPSTINPQPIGNRSYRMIRSHPMIHLVDNEIFRIRPLGQSPGAVDISGQSYIARQQRFLGQKLRNLREFSVSRMFRGGFHLQLEGDRWNPIDPTAAAPALEVGYQVPAANRTILTNFDVDGVQTVGTNNAITVSDWTAAGGTPIADITELNAYNVQQNGFSLRHGWISSATWMGIINTTEAKAVAGTANRVFTTQTSTGPTGEDGRQDSGFIGILEGLPWFTFHITDQVIKVAGTKEPVVNVGDCIITPDPDPAWIEMQTGSEMVRENVTSPAVERYGLTAWTEPTTKPSGFDLIGLDNFLPALLVPGTVYYMYFGP